MLIRFLFYGLLGWIMEIIFTGSASLLQGDWRLPGSTFLWMLPIYGLGVFAEKVHDFIRGWPWLLRGVIWLAFFWTVEYASGWLLQALTGVCPWDYSGSPYSFHGFIRLDMAPDWFVAGLLFEKAHDWLDGILARLNSAR